MELQTISQISKQFSVSTRTLRYYEQIGLIQPIKKEDFAYRVYDENTVVRLQQIIVLRKLRIPLRQIAEILRSDDTAVAISAFNQNLAEIDDEIAALSTIRSVIQSLLEQLHLQSDMLPLLDDENLLEIMDSLTASKINFKEAKTMDDLNKASDKLNKLTNKEVRIIYLPPATVASIYHIGGDPGPESITGDLIFDFIKTNNLAKIKPDFRHYGFNRHAEGKPEGMEHHGYERWVTIPDDMDVSAPFVKKQFAGGLYAAFMIPMGDFHMWEVFYDYVKNLEKYEIRWAGGDSVHLHGWDGCMEEHLNVINHYMWSQEECDKFVQLDLLLPIKERE